MKTIVQKVLVAVLLVMLAFAAWSQRESLQECADRSRRTSRIVTGRPCRPTHRAGHHDVPAEVPTGSTADVAATRHVVHVLRGRRDRSRDAPGRRRERTDRRPGSTWVSRSRRWPPSPARRPSPTPRCGGSRRSCRRWRARSAPRPRSSPRCWASASSPACRRCRRRPPRPRPRAAGHGDVAGARVDLVDHRPRRDAGHVRRRLRRARAGRLQLHRRRPHLDQPPGGLSLARPVVRLLRDVVGARPPARRADRRRADQPVRLARTVRRARRRRRGRRRSSSPGSCRTTVHAAIDRHQSRRSAPDSDPTGATCTRTAR